jgi:hypothetical protein
MADAARVTNPPSRADRNLRGMSLSLQDAPEGSVPSADLDDAPDWAGILLCYIPVAILVPILHAFDVVLRSLWTAAKLHNVESCRELLLRMPAKLFFGTMLNFCCTLCACWSNMVGATWCEPSVVWLLCIMPLWRGEKGRKMRALALAHRFDAKELRTLVGRRVSMLATHDAEDAVDDEFSGIAIEGEISPLGQNVGAPVAPRRRRKKKLLVKRPKPGLPPCILTILAWSLATATGLNNGYYGTSAAAGLVIIIGPLFCALAANMLWHYVNGSLLKTKKGTDATPQEPVAEPHHGSEPAPRPIVQPDVLDATSSAGMEFLQTCENEMAELDVILCAAGEDQTEWLNLLRDKYFLAWEGVPGLMTASHKTFSVANLEHHAKRVRSLALRYPTSTDPLLQGPFSWEKPPCRAVGEEAVEWELRTWKESSSSAADSSVFSSMGLWISPYAVSIMSGLSLMALWTIYSNGPMPNHVVYKGGTGSLFLGFGGAAIALKRGQRKVAMWSNGAGFVGCAIMYSLEAAFSMCQCIGVYAEVHPPGSPGRQDILDNPWQWSWFCIVSAIIFFVDAGTSTHPWHTFTLLFVWSPVMFGTSTFLLGPFSEPLAHSC